MIRYYYASDIAGFTLDEAIEIGEEIGIVWDDVDFDPEDFQMGLDVELEHGTVDPDTNITDDDPVATGKIAWAHLKESPDYYVMLADMEEQMPPDDTAEAEARIGVTELSRIDARGAAASSVLVATNSLLAAIRALRLRHQQLREDRDSSEEQATVIYQIRVLQEEYECLRGISQAIGDGRDPEPCQA